MITLNQQIEARRRLNPSEVRLHHVPTWLARRIREKLRPDSGLANWRLLELARQKADCPDSAIDHWGSTILADGTEAFVSEPYMNNGDLFGAQRLAKLLDLDLQMSSNSWWFPGNTKRLIFTPKKVSQKEAIRRANLELAQGGARALHG